MPCQASRLATRALWPRAGSSAAPASAMKRTRGPRDPQGTASSLPRHTRYVVGPMCTSSRTEAAILIRSDQDPVVPEQAHELPSIDWIKPVTSEARLNGLMTNHPIMSLATGRACPCCGPDWSDRRWPGQNLPPRRPTDRGCHRRGQCRAGESSSMREVAPRPPRRQGVDDEHQQQENETVIPNPFTQRGVT